MTVLLLSAVLAAALGTVVYHGLMLALEAWDDRQYRRGLENAETRLRQMARTIPVPHRDDVLPRDAA